MKNILTLAIFFAFIPFSHSQTIVNQNWVMTGGSPTAMYDFHASHFDAVHNLYVVGNTFHAGQKENFLIQRYNSSGVLQWQKEYDGTLSNTDFATDVTTIGTNIYVTGVEGDTSAHTTHITTIKLSATGVIQWTATYTGSFSGYNIPARIVPNAAGTLLYVCGTSQTSATDFAMVTLCYNTSGTQQWVQRYDSTGLYSGGADLKVTESSLISYGVSGLSSSSGDFITRSYNLSTGTPMSSTRVNNPNSYITKPIGIVKDNAENIYFAGVVQTGAGNTDIKIVKLDSLLNVKWTKTIDGGASKNDEVTGIKIDLRGNVVLTGFAAASDTSKSVWTLRLQDSVILWNQKYFCPIAGHDAKGLSVDLDSLGNIYVTGKIYASPYYNDITLAYDTSGNLKWQKTYSYGSAYINSGTNIIVDSGYVYVNGISTLGGSSTYHTIQYGQYTKTDSLVSSANGGQYMNNQIIIKFDPSWVNQTAVNNTAVDIAPPSYWLTHTADSALQAKVTFDLTTCMMQRIYKGLKTTYKYSTARNGDKVLIPPLWSAFLLIHPTGEVGDVATAQQINTLYPMVEHTGLNYVGRLQSSCDDPDPHPASCRINDQYFGGSNPMQWNLWLDSNNSCGHYYNIDIDSAWQLSTGKSFIKVGVYDSGLDGLNGDFCADDAMGGYQSGLKAGGWDFYNNASLASTGWSSPDNSSFAHGTMVSGIIGAIRNNGVGIAGIAGGNWSATDTNNFGVTLYGMKILQDSISGMSNQLVITLPITDLCNALVIGCTYTDSGYGYGFHVINNSWGMMTDSNAAGFVPPPRGLSDMELGELEQAFKYVYRNQTTIVAAAGNDKNATLFPANFYGDWIVCVGGADDTGAYYVNHGNTGQTTYYESYPGSCVDLIAPSVTDPANLGYSIATTTYRSSNLHGGYTYDEVSTTFGGAYGGTSLAAPHATGTIGLLMSYLDSNAAVYQNLSPEDAEHLLTRSADNKGYVGRSDSTGWGDLNAGRSLQSVNKRCTELLHFGLPRNLGGQSAILEKWYTPIKLTERYTNPNGKVFDTATYLCHAYKYVCNMPNTLPTNFTITDSWTRPSSTNLLLNYDSVHHTLQPFEHLNIDTLTSTHSVISGYFYYVFDPTDSVQLGFWGIDSSYAHGIDTTSRFDFTLLITNPTVSCNPVTAIEEVESHLLDVSFYPNPVQDAGVLQIFTDKETIASIDVFDLEGRKTESVYSGTLASGGSNFMVDTKALSSGVYFVTVNSPDGRKTIKFIKL